MPSAFPGRCPEYGGVWFCFSFFSRGQNPITDYRAYSDIGISTSEQCARKDVQGFFLLYQLVTATKYHDDVSVYTAKFGHTKA